MSTAADELRAASATLWKLASDATPGPWTRPLNTRYKATVTGPLPEGERGGWIDGIDPATGEREQCTVATIPIWSNGKHSRQRGGRDLEYIAAMHPGVGKALADWLEFHAAMDERLLALVDGAPGMDEATWDGKPHPALTLARALNGGEQR